jgi:hypothetical protein
MQLSVSENTIHRPEKAGCFARLSGSFGGSIALLLSDKLQVLEIFLSTRESRGIRPDAVLSDMRISLLRIFHYPAATPSISRLQIVFAGLFLL